MDLSNLQYAEGSKQSGSFRRGRGHGSGNGKRLVRVIKARRHVQALRDRALKAVRCHYTEEFPREDLPIGIPK